MNDLKANSDSSETRGQTSAPWVSAAYLLLVAVLPWTIAPMGIAAGVAAAATLWVWWSQSPRGLPATPVNRAAIAWAIALGLAALFAVDRSGSLPRLKKALFPLLVLIATTLAMNGRAGRAGVAVLLASAAAASLVGIWQVAGQIVDFGMRSSGPVGHYMTYAGQLLLFVSLALGVTLMARGWIWRAGAAVTALLGSAALLGTFTRSAWLGVIVSAAVILGRWKPRWLMALAAVVVIIVLAAPASYRDRMASAFDPSHATNVERTHMWGAGWRMFLDHPLTGVGLQDLHPLYETYGDPDAREAAGHLHSVPVQLAATMGIVGLAAFAWLFVGLFRCAGSGLSETMRRGGVAAGVRLGILGALCGFLVAGLFEWNAGDEELLYPLYVLAGMAWAARNWDCEGGDG